MMPVTRAHDYPAEWAQLFEAFNHCADGHEMHIVIDVAANLLVAAIVNNATARGHSAAEVDNSTRMVCEGVVDMVRRNFRRQGKSSDMPVQSN